MLKSCSFPGASKFRFLIGEISARDKADHRLNPEMESSLACYHTADRVLPTCNNSNIKMEDDDLAQVIVLAHPLRALC